MVARWTHVCLASLPVLIVALLAHAQPANLQLWGNVTLGYRRRFAWGFEVLYIWTRTRNTIEEGFTTTTPSTSV